MSPPGRAWMGSCGPAGGVLGRCSDRWPTRWPAAGAVGPFSRQGSLQSARGPALVAIFRYACPWTATSGHRNFGASERAGPPRSARARATRRRSFTSTPCAPGGTTPGLPARSPGPEGRSTGLGEPAQPGLGEPTPLSGHRRAGGSAPGSWALNTAPASRARPTSQSHIEMWPAVADDGGVWGPARNRGARPACTRWRGRVPARMAAHAVATQSCGHGGRRSGRRRTCRVTRPRQSTTRIVGCHVPASEDRGLTTSAVLG